MNESRPSIVMASKSHFSGRGEKNGLKKKPAPSEKNDKIFVFYMQSSRHLELKLHVFWEECACD